MRTSKALSDAIDLQDRDFALLRGLLETRIMTANHIATLYFEDKREYTTKRLQKLKAAGFIAERRRRVNQSAILFLTRKAFGVLHDRGSLSEYPSLGIASLERRAQVSELTINHELEIMDVRCAFHSALAEAGQFILDKFCTWPLMYQFEAFRSGQESAQVRVKPDVFILIHERERDGGLSEHTFFFELDRSSETQDTLVGKAGCYLDYYKSGGFAVRNGADRAAYKDYPFRVLMVLKSAERRNNTAEALLQNTPPIFTQVYLTTFGEVTTNPLGAIWMRPIDYRNATQGTPYDHERRRGSFGYRRQSAREDLVEMKVKKLQILADPTEA
jgi:hypothetical protein